MHRRVHQIACSKIQKCSGIINPDPGYLSTNNDTGTPIQPTGAKMATESTAVRPGLLYDLDRANVRF